MEKYSLNKEVYIVHCNKVIKCKVIEITKNASGVKYQLLDENVFGKHEYLRLEPEVFQNEEEANNYIRKLHYQEKVSEMNIEICDYQEWVSNLDLAIQKHENCKTNMKITLISNETNTSDEVIFSVTNTGSKLLLENIRKYFKEELDKRVKELEEFKNSKN